MPEVQPALLVWADVFHVEFEPAARAALHGKAGVSVSTCADETTLTLIHRDGTMLCALLNEEQLDTVAHQLAVLVEQGNGDLRRRRLQ